MELAKSIIEPISSICVLGGVIWAAYKAVALFHYKYDAEIRNMYIENCRNVRKIMGKIITTKEADIEDVIQIKSLLFDAMIYLHKDIVDFVYDVFSNIRFIQTFTVPLTTIDNKNSIVKKSKICLDEESLNKIMELNNRSIALYRKHIVKDGLSFDKFKEIFNIKNDKK